MVDPHVHCKKWKSNTCTCNIQTRSLVNNDAFTKFIYTRVFLYSFNEIV